MQKISTAQLRKIHVLSRQRDLDNDTLHAHVYTVTKKESLKQLTIMEAVAVIDSLEGKPAHVQGMMSGKQQKFIYALLKQMGWTTENGEPDRRRFMDFVKAQYGVEQEKWITSKIAGKVIEAFKNMADRQQKEA